ncbi:MAG: efflux RND transporter periplasmic adaptor subunit [Parachlamydiales bacterium]|jgi:HlyD family secretion protein
MKIKIYLIIGLILLLGVSATIYFSKKNNKKPNELIILGNVDIRQVELGFRVFGRVQNVLFDEGDEVKEGQLMAVLDKIPYEEDVAKAQAQYESIDFDLKNFEAKFQKRTQVAPNAISKEDYDDSFYNLQTMRAKLKEAKAQLDSALTNYEDTQIFCPTEGVILSRIREPGSILIQGEPVYTLSIKSPVWIRAYVSEPNLGKIYFGMPATILTDSNQVYKGHIGFISPVAEFTPKNVETLELRTDLVYRLRVIVDNPDYALKQGMPVTVKLQLNKQNGK